MSPKGPPFNFFDILRQNGRSKNPKGSPFHIFRHYATYRRLQKIFKKIGKTFSHFFHYFDIVRPFRQKNPQRFRLHFFWSFAAEWMLKNTKRSPFQFFFGIVKLFNSFSPKAPPSNFLMICDRRDEKCQSVSLARQSGPTFGFLGCFRREYFDTLKSFCYFWALDMAPTWAVPGLFTFSSVSYQCLIY